MKKKGEYAKLYMEQKELEEYGLESKKGLNVEIGVEGGAR